MNSELDTCKEFIRYCLEHIEKNGGLHLTYHDGAIQTQGGSQAASSMPLFYKSDYERQVSSSSAMNNKDELAMIRDLYEAELVIALLESIENRKQLH